MHPYGPPYAPIPEPPRKSWPRRHKILTGLGAAAALIVILSVIAALAAPQKKHQDSNAVAVNQPTTTAPAPTTAPAAPAPVPSPAGNITTGGMGCDTSLSASIYGQNWLTAQVTAHNTGNIGTVVRIRVTWPLQGFAPITKTKTVRTRPGHSKQVEFRVPVSENQISNFQDAQIAAAGDPCHYHASIVNTFGEPQG